MDTLRLGVFRTALPTAGVNPVVPLESIGSEKRAFFLGLFAAVVVSVGFIGEVAALDLLGRRAGTGSVSAIIAGVIMQTTKCSKYLIVDEGIMMKKRE